MNFQIYLEEPLRRELDDLRRRTGTKRNALVREAIRQYIERQKSRQWPESVVEFKPEKSFPRFETARKTLSPPKDVVF